MAERGSFYGITARTCAAPRRERQDNSGGSDEDVWENPDAATGRSGSRIPAGCWRDDEPQNRFVERDGTGVDHNEFTVNAPVQTRHGPRARLLRR
jgi:hypothetical protein